MLKAYPPSDKKGFFQSFAELLHVFSFFGITAGITFFILIILKKNK